MWLFLCALCLQNARNVLVASCNDAPSGVQAKLADLGLSRSIKQHQTHRTTNTVGGLGGRISSHLAGQSCHACHAAVGAPTKWAWEQLSKHQPLCLWAVCMPLPLLSTVRHLKDNSRTPHLLLCDALTHQQIGTMSHMSPEMLRSGQMSVVSVQQECRPAQRRVHRRLANSVGVGAYAWRVAAPCSLPASAEHLRCSQLAQV